MALNKTLALEYLRKGYRVFETDSDDNALLIVWNKPETRHKFKKAGLRSVTARLETNTYSLPFTQPHPLLDTKVKVKRELFG